MTVVNADRSTHYCIDPGVEDILTLFEEPRSLRGKMSLLRQIATDVPIEDGLFDELIDIGAIIRTLGDERGQLAAARSRQRLDPGPSCA